MDIITIITIIALVCVIVAMGWRLGRVEAERDSLMHQNTQHRVTIVQKDEQMANLNTQLSAERALRENAEDDLNIIEKLGDTLADATMNLLKKEAAREELLQRRREKRKGAEAENDDED